MSKTIRRVIAVLLAVTGIIIAVLPAKDAAATTAIDQDFVFDGNTLIKYNGNADVLTLPNWTVTVGTEAFAGNQTLSKLVLPDSVRTIDFSAFENCTNLLHVDMSNEIREVASSAFSGCNNLSYISFPDKLRKLGSGVFAGCNSLADVPISLGNDNYYCLDGVIYSIDGRELVQYLAGRPYMSYAMPDTVETIYDYAFWGASELNDVSISHNVHRIPEYSFANCKGLKNMILPYSVQTISAYAFADCVNLDYINIPESVGYIDSKAFYMTGDTVIKLLRDDGLIVREMNVKELPQGEFSEEQDDALNAEEGKTSDDDVNSNVYDYVNSENDMINNSGDYNEATAQVGNSVAAFTQGTSGKTYNGSFSGNGNWISEINNIDFTQNSLPGELGSTKIVGGHAMVMIPEDTPVKGYDLADAESEDDYAESSGWVHSVDQNQNVDLTSQPDNSEDKSFTYAGSESSVSVPDGTKIIAERAFYKNEDVYNVSLPDSLEKIEDFAFARSAVSSVNIPNGCKTIGYGAFYNCPNLEEIYIPSSVDNIELGAFDGTAWLYNLKNNSSENEYVIVGDGILLSYNGNNKKVNIPPNVKQVGAGAFAGNTTIESVNLPESVNAIGEDAFNNCINLKEVVLSEGLKNIHDRAFKNTSVKTLVIPNSVEGIGLGAFDTTENGSPLETVILSGNDVPEVIYNNTATRMSSDKLRTKALEGVENVIVNNKCNMNSGSLFDLSSQGFSGQIYTIDDTVKYGNNLKLLRSNKEPDENGVVNINPSVHIGYDEYIMTNADDDAFSPYINWNKWTKNQPKKIIIEGNTSPELQYIIDNTLNESARNVSSDDHMNVNISGTAFGENPIGRASLSNNNTDFALNIYQDNTIKNDIISSYYDTYGTYPDNTAVYLTIELYDSNSTVPIKKLGTNKLEVSIPVPNTMKDNSDIRIACMEDDGKLYELASNVTSVDGIPTLDFVASHIGKYVIFPKYVFDSEDIEFSYNLSDEAASPYVLSGVIAGTLQKEVIKGIEAKWFVVVILFSISAVLVLYRPRKKHHI